MCMNIFDGTNGVVSCAGDSSSPTAVMPFGAFPINILQINIVTNVFVTVKVKQFVAAK